MSDKVQKLSFDNVESTKFEGQQERKRRKPTEEKTVDEIMNDKQKKRELQELKNSEFYNGPGINMKTIKSTKQRKLKNKLEHGEANDRFASLAALHATQVLLPSAKGSLVAEGRSKTFQFRQKDILENVGDDAKKNVFDLRNLEYGPYHVDYTLNGRHMLIGGRKGHLALFDCHNYHLNTEFNVSETIRAVQFLHNETMFAVAQKKYLYIYDNQGLELHALRQHEEPTQLQFLPYHYLLACGTKTGALRYQDTSTGTIMAEHRTHKGEIRVMKQNKTNAILHLGHNNGLVTLWSPNMSAPLVTMQCHKGPITSLAIDHSGHNMATAGLDGQVRVWDIRTYKEVHSYFSVRPATTMDISQGGMLALGYGPHVQIWKDAFRQKQASPYLTELYGGDSVQSVQFRPYEDILGVGLSSRVTTMLIPGAGEANFDTFEHNPFQTKKQRDEKTVRTLIEKLQPDMITLDTRAFTVMSAANEAEATKEEAVSLKESKRVKINLERHRTKGRNKTHKKAIRRTQMNVQKATEERNERIVQEQEDAKAAKVLKEKNQAAGIYTSTLDRFK